MANFDHLVVAAHTLEQGTTFIETLLGVAPVGGGRHAAMGTHNRVLRLGRERYLEIIAVDPDAASPGFPRWFNLDDHDLQTMLTTRPRLIAWVARTRSIDRLVAAYRHLRLEIRSMQRDALRWRFAFTVDGSLPGGGLIPHLIQWQSQTHPTEKMPESGCRLLSLEGAHPDREAIQETIDAMDLTHAIDIRRVSGRGPAELVARLDTPVGEVILD